MPNILQCPVSTTALVAPAPPSSNHAPSCFFPQPLCRLTWPKYHNVRVTMLSMGQSSPMFRYYSMSAFFIILVHGILRNFLNHFSLRAPIFLFLYSLWNFPLLNSYVATGKTHSLGILTIIRLLVPCHSLLNLYSFWIAIAHLLMMACVQFPLLLIKEPRYSQLVTYSMSSLLIFIFGWSLVSSKY